MHFPPLKKLLWFFLAGFTVLCFTAIVSIIYFESQLPDVKALKSVQLQVPLRIFANDGTLIAEYGSERRSPVHLDQIPPAVIDATLSTEDQRYFYHSGVDLLGLARAGVVLVLTGRKEQGGSTITMQVARNYFLTRKKTFTRKIREILLAYKIDHTLNKNKVLELYFNKIFYGNHAYGIAAAAHVYYGKKLSELTLAESATLAGLPQAPSTLNPIVNPEAALKRRNHVLARMLEQGYITEAQYQQAINEPIHSRYHGLKISVRAPYVAETVRNEIAAEYGDDAYTTGINVYTTINPKLQTYANRAINNAVLAYDQRHGYRGPIENLGDYDSSQLPEWKSTLKTIPSMNTLHPAAVISINNDAKTVTAMLASGKFIMIPWSGMAWARSQFFRGDQEFLGRVPEQPGDILKVGDVIYANHFQKQWLLAQAPQVEAALIAINPNDGSILSLVGGYNYSQSNFNRVLQAYRQPGSSFKPFIYSAALEKGFTLASMLNDSPVVLNTSGSGLWRPENDTHKFYGLISLKEALIQSRNLASIRLLQLIGIPYAINYATRFGFDPDDLPDGLSLALGTASVTPIQMAIGYSVFANGGYRVQPHLITSIKQNGKVLFQTETPYVCNDQCQQQRLLANSDELLKENKNWLNRSFAAQAITPQNAFLMTQAMKAVITNGTAIAARQLNRSDLAGKTGTTNDKVDAWFCGYNHRLVAITWMGFDKPRSLYEYGNRAALPIWINFMSGALKGEPLSNLPQPPGIVSVRIDSHTGQLAGPNDQNATFEYFAEGTVPKFSSAPAANEGGGDDSGSQDNTESTTIEQEIY